MATIIGVTSSSKKQTSIKTINGYIGGSSARFCAGRTEATVVYNPTYSTIATAYTNNSTIYSDSGLTTSATAGYYSDTSGGPRQTNYYWNGRGWSGFNEC